MTLLNLRKDHTMFIDKRKSQADLQKDRISRMITQKKREKTMTIERKSQQVHLLVTIFYFLYIFDFFAKLVLIITQLGEVGF